MAVLVVPVIWKEQTKLLLSATILHCKAILDQGHPNRLNRRRYTFRGFRDAKGLIQLKWPYSTSKMHIATSDCLLLHLVI